MKASYLKILITTLAFTLPLTVNAEDEHHQTQASENTALALPADIKPLLTKEMQQIQLGMMNLLPAISSGQWDKIAEIAKEMQGSYIMKQQLTKEQMQTLHKTLPPAFIGLDQNFHRLAGMLAHVAEERKSELVNFYFYKLTESCGQCHSQYAQQRFPAFAEQGNKEHHH
ncbi:MAG: hypothetical protein GQ569_14365 [Methylococcaceae bacterium]|nr:hypothetical protein [Methylococcaceae bacterium]